MRRRIQPLRVLLARREGFLLPLFARSAVSGFITLIAALAALGSAATSVDVWAQPGNVPAAVRFQGGSPPVVAPGRAATEVTFELIARDAGASLSGAEQVRVTFLDSNADGGELRFDPPSFVLSGNQVTGSGLTRIVRIGAGPSVRGPLNGDGQRDAVTLRLELASRDQSVSEVTLQLHLLPRFRLSFDPPGVLETGVTLTVNVGLFDDTSLPVQGESIAVDGLAWVPARPAYLTESVNLAGTMLLPGRTTVSVGFDRRSGFSEDEIPSLTGFLIAPTGGAVSHPAYAPGLTPAATAENTPLSLYPRKISEERYLVGFFNLPLPFDFDLRHLTPHLFRKYLPVNPAYELELGRELVVPLVVAPPLNREDEAAVEGETKVDAGGDDAATPGQDYAVISKAGGNSIEHEFVFATSINTSYHPTAPASASVDRSSNKHFFYQLSPLRLSVDDNSISFFDLGEFLITDPSSAKITIRAPSISLTFDNEDLVNHGELRLTPSLTRNVLLRVSDVKPLQGTESGEFVATAEMGGGSALTVTPSRFTLSATQSAVNLTITGGAWEGWGTLRVAPVKASFRREADPPVRLLNDEPAEFRLSVFSVTPVLTIEDDSLNPAVEEGAAAVITVNLSRPLSEALTVGYEIGLDAVADTNDAEESDYTGGGPVTIEAGRTSATIEIQITDDNEIEPTREVFRVSLTESENGIYKLIPDSSTAIIVINEGVCDRRGSVRAAVVEAVLDVDDCAGVDDRDLRRIDNELTVEVEVAEVGGNVDDLRHGDFWGFMNLRELTVSSPMRAISLSTNMFAGLDSLEQLFLADNGIEEIPTGVFLGLGSLTTLRLERNALTDLKPAQFSDLARLHTLDLDTNPQLTTLAPGAFSGLDRLRILSLSDTGLTRLPDNLFNDLELDELHLPAAAVLPLRFEVVDDSDFPSSVRLTVALAPGAPFDLSVGLSQVNAILSTLQVSIPRGTTQSMALTMRRENPNLEASVSFINPPVAPQGSDVIYDVTDTFVLVDGARTSSVAIESTPAEDGVYAAGEKIIVAVTFSSPVHVSTADGSPTLALEIGDAAREMHLAGTGTDTLRFEYTVSEQDYDADGISIGRDALMLGGASITDDSGNSALLRLGEHEIVDALGHRVAGRRLSLALELQTESVVAGSFATATLTLVGTELLDEDDDAVAVSLTPAEDLDAPRMVTLERESFSAQFRVSVQPDARLSLTTLTASVAQNVQNLIAARVASTALSVRIDPRVFSLSFVPPTVTVTAGEASTWVELKLEEETGFLTETEMVAVSLAQMGVDMTLDPAAVSFAHDRKTETIRVGAGPDATPGDHVVRADDPAAQLNTQISEANLQVTVLPREISVLFEPSGIRLVRGGLAAEATSETVILRAKSGLRGADEVVVDLSATGGLRVMPEEVRLNLANSTAEVVVEADADSRAGEVSATLNEGGSSFGSAFVTTRSLTVEVVRRVGLTLSGHESSNIATVVAGGTTDVTVTTSPPLEAGEEARVTVNVATGLTLIGGDQLILTGENRSATIRISAVVPELDLAEGVSSSGTGVNVELVAGASLRVVSVPADDVSVALSPRLIEVQQGADTAFRVATAPGLAEGQSATVRLTIMPTGANLSFSDDSFVTTVALAGGAGQSSVVEVAVKASPDAMIGSTAQVTSMVEEFAGVRVDAGGQSQATLSVVTPRVTVGFTPAAGELGEALTLNLGTSKRVTLSLTDFALSGGQTAVLRVSVAGEGLTLQDGMPSLDLSLTAESSTAEVTVLASVGAESVGRVEARAIGGVELAGGRRAAVLPIEALQAVTLRFDPEPVLIERNRSTEFMVMMIPALIVDRAATVTLSVPEPAGFRFTEGGVRHQAVLTPGKAAETVSVSATAEINSTIAVSVDVDAAVGVALGPLPSLELKVVTPRVTVTFEPPEIAAVRGGTATFTVTLVPALTAGQSATVTLTAPEGLSLSSLTLTFDGEETTRHEVEISVDARAPLGEVEITSILEPGGFDLAKIRSSLPVEVSAAPGQGARLRIRVFLEGALE